MGSERRNEFTVKFTSSLFRSNTNNRPSLTEERRMVKEENEEQKSGTKEMGERPRRNETINQRILILTSRDANTS